MKGTRFLYALLLSHSLSAAEALVDAAPPGATLEIRYAGSDNFMAKPVKGYEAPRCLLSQPAADALAGVQAEVQRFGLNLVIYDCYRPQRAVDHFMRWTADDADDAGRAQYYPEIPKNQLVPLGYIADQSGHSRGSTLDLTLAYPDGTLLDMGTHWDFFDPLSNTENAAVSPLARANRLLLRAIMEKHGFSNYPAEWWHFTLVDEPFPDTYFDQPIR